MTAEQQILEQAGFTKEDGREYVKTEGPLEIHVFEIDENYWMAEIYEADGGPKVGHISRANFGTMFYILAKNIGAVIAITVII